MSTSFEKAIEGLREAQKDVVMHINLELKDKSLHEASKSQAFVKLFELWLNLNKEIDDLVRQQEVFGWNVRKLLQTNETTEA